MTTIERLGITGIRSYGTERETFIRFGTPLTIILGRNGSGKSTVIESIRMASTGQLPPMVGTGAAFIHDPRIDNETETKAKIRLQFTNARGDQYVVSRHFMLSVKRATRNSDKVKLEFKRLDQTLKRSSEKGKSAASSYRCSDLDAMLPEIMRVSKPILNNVIFVHQEDAHWPLGKQEELKKRFDEIFAATRYTKALDSIRKFRKEQAHELRTITKELELFEERVKTLDKLQKENDDLKERQTEMKNSALTVKAEIEVLHKIKESAMDVAKDYDEKLQKHKELKNDVEKTEQVKARILSEMKEYFKDVEDSWLRQELVKLKDRLKGIEGESMERKASISHLRAKKEQLEKVLNEKNSKKGVCENKLLNHEKDVKKLDEMKQNFQNDSRFSANSSIILSLEMSNEDWARALGQIQTVADDSYTFTVDECRKVEDEASKQSSNAQTNLRSVEQDVHKLKTRLKELDRDIPRKRNSIRDKGDIRSRTQQALEKEKALKSRLDERLAMKTMDELKQKQADARTESNVLKEKLDRARDLRKDLDRDRDARTEVELAHKNVSAKRTELKSVAEDFLDSTVAASREVSDVETMVPGYNKQTPSFHMDRLHNLDLENTERANLSTVHDELRDASQSVLKRRDALLNYLVEDVRNHSSKASDARTRKIELGRQLKKTQDTLRKKEMDLARARDRLAVLPRTECLPTLEEDLSQLFENALVVSDGSGCNISSDKMVRLDETLTNFDKEKTKQYQRAALAGSWPGFWKQLIERFESDPKHACPACGLSAKKKVDSMRKTLNQELEKASNPEREQQLKRDAETLKSTGEALKTLRDISSTVTSVTESFKPLKISANEAEKEVSECTECHQKAVDLENQVKRRLGSESASEKLEVIAGDFYRVRAELTRYDRKLADAESSLPSRSRHTKSLEEVIEEITELEDKRAELEAEKDRLGRKISREQEDTNKLSVDYSSAMERSKRLQEEGRVVEQQEQEVKEMTEERRTVESEIGQLEPKVKDMRSQFEDAELRLKTVREDQGRKIDEAMRKKQRVKTRVGDFEKLFREINTFIRSGERDALPVLLQQITQTEEDVKELKVKLEKLESELDTASNGEASIRDRIRNIEGNIEYRGKDKEIEEVQNKMHELQEDVNEIRAQVDGGNPHEVVRIHSEALTGLRDRLLERKTKHTMLTEQLREKRKELNKEEARGSRKQYDECRITKQTMELASSDLAKYHRALDQALMAFHTLKMNSINRIIKELWQQTYRGTDIDEIEIASDAGESLSTATSGKRNYNYRVMMRQGQAQLEMRGRCSAGQKVLACLVIRLALAESFCTDCGILALDEPTTNLDTENIESLANALKSIIELRKKQKNFQLVLITHDRHFIEMIGAREFANEYFMVYKDTDGISHAQVKDLIHLPE